MSAHHISLRAKSDILTVTAFVGSLADVATEKRAALDGAIESLAKLRPRVDRLVRLRAELVGSLSVAERDRADEAIDIILDRLDDARIEVCKCMKACRQAMSYAERFARFAARAMAGDVEADTLETAAAAIAAGCAGLISVNAKRAA